MTNLETKNFADNEAAIAGRSGNRGRLLAALGGLTLALSAAGSMTAQAQVNVPSPPTRGELTPMQAQPEERPSVTLTIDGEMARTPCALDSPRLAEVMVTLSSVTFVGADAATDVDLAQSYASYIGRELPISVLCDIRAQATSQLTDAGYLAAVEIPEQRLSGGAAEFRVVLGRLTALRIRGDAGPSERVLERYLQNLVGEEVFNTKQAERYLLLADDIPSMDVRLGLRPAANGVPGDLVGEVAVLRRRAVVDVNIQNYGSRALGRFGGLVRAEAYDLTGLGDRTAFSVYTSHDFDEQLTLALDHEFMVGDDGLVVGGGVTLGWTNPSIGLAGFDVESETFYANLHATYPVLRTQETSVHTTLGFDLVDQNVDINDVNLSRDRVRTVFTGISVVNTDIDSLAHRNGYTPFEPRFRIAGYAEVRQGLSLLGANPDCRTTPANCVATGELPSRVEQDPTPTLIRGELHTEYRPVPIMTIAFDLEAQFTRDPLPAFEEFSGGNYTIGRGYNPSSVAGDSGIGTSLELRYGSLVPDTIDSFAWQPYVFADWVTVWDRDPSQRPLNPDSLVSLGAGMRFTHGRGVQGDFSVAVPLKRTDGQAARNDVRILFSLTSRLFPWRF